MPIQASSAAVADTSPISGTSMGGAPPQMSAAISPITSAT